MNGQDEIYIKKLLNGKKASKLTLRNSKNLEKLKRIPRKEIDQDDRDYGCCQSQVVSSIVGPIDRMSLETASLGTILGLNPAIDNDETVVEMDFKDLE